MFLADAWKDYEILDSGEGYKLERWKNVVLSRPDPQTIWPKEKEELWKNADAVYQRSESGGGRWIQHRKIPERWQINYKDIAFYVRPTGFKHTGLFPEQAANWDWMRSLVRGKRNIKVLNLFAYTGAATVALCKEGAHVTHVDAAKGMVEWAKENRDLSNIEDNKTRFIVEDALRFVRREIRRGNSYQGILMDPPSYGRGPTGEVWKLENELYQLVEESSRLLADDALFFLINSYTTGFQASVLSNILGKTVAKALGGKIEADELCLPVASGGVMPCGTSGRWSR